MRRIEVLQRLRDGWCWQVCNGVQQAFLQVEMAKLENVQHHMPLSAAGLNIAYFDLTQAPAQREEETRECPRCSGSGYEDCICTRWSDNDVGCAACNGSAKMVCRSCGGGGTAVPAPAKIVARR